MTIQLSRGFIAFLVIIGLIGSGYYSGVITPNTPDPTETPTTIVTNSAQQAATAISQMTITPGVESNGQLPTVIPWTDSYQLGDETLLIDAMHQLYATKSFNLTVTTVNTYGGTGIYCIAQYASIPFMGANWDHSIPLYQEVTNGKYLMIPNSRYCSMWLVMGELWGGVVQNDIRVAQIYTPETKPAVISPGTTWVLLTETQLPPVDDEATKTHIYKSTVAIEVHIPFGLLTSSVQPKNQVKKTLGSAPNGVMVEIINATNGDAPNYQVPADAADTYARWLADYDMIAPIAANGSRDMSHLNQLKAEMERSFNNPTPAGAQAKWPYDDLLVDMTTLATQAGYQGVNSLKVILEWPTGIENEWVTLESLAAHSLLDLVVNPTDLDFNKNNLYPLFKPEVSQTLSWDQIPDWARSWIHLP